MISQRANNALNVSQLLLESWLRYKANPFSEDNHSGIINLGTAENRLCEDLIASKLKSINLSLADPRISHYCSFHGLEDFRESLSNFFTDYMKAKVKITPGNIFVTNGGGPSVEMLGFTLCDQHEGIMVPVPYYGSFENDLNSRFSTNLYPIDIMDINEDGVEIDISKLKNAYHELKIKGQAVRGILISHPINPLGVAFSTKQLQRLLEFCLTNDIHLICDEMYFLSVYDKSHMHKNILGLPNISKYLHIIHVIWAFSKDLAMSGFRCATIITYNKGVQQCLKKTSYFTSTPTVAQFILNEFIKDKKWLESYLISNCKRLKQSRDIICHEFHGYNIKYVSAYSGIFAVVNLKNYLKEKTFDSEYELFQTFLNNGIYIVPGQTFHFKEPGWFRIIFGSNIELREGLKRIKEVLHHSDKSNTS